MGMGTALALVDAGLRVAGFDVDPSRLRAFEEGGGIACESPAAMAAHTAARAWRDWAWNSAATHTNGFAASESSPRRRTSMTPSGARSPRIWVCVAGGTTTTRWPFSAA